MTKTILFDNYIKNGVYCANKADVDQFMLLGMWYSSFDPKKLYKIATKKRAKHSFEQFTDWYMLFKKNEIKNKQKTLLSKTEAGRILTKIYHKKVEIK
jgi:hypothetical protein